MGICSRRHFLLTICSLQLITTIERQIFDFLGFMWAPILANFFNIIFVILGFFGAFQYRPKYIISYCVWNTLWLGWNVFTICFYLDVGTLDKESDLLSFRTGSYSWWESNGPGCKIVNEITEPEIYRSRPNATDCILRYEVIEVMHASTQCILGLMAVVGGICLSRVFLEEDDSFDFVGGDDFGLAGHTPLHPMYVSYSALPPPVYPTINSNKSLNRSEQSFVKNDDGTIDSSLTTTSVNRSSISRQYERSNRTYEDANILTRSLSPCEEYDYFDSESPFSRKIHLEMSKKVQNSTSSRYSPVLSPKMRRARYAKSRAPISKSSASKRRVFTDYVREQPLRSFYSDPRLSRDVTSDDSVPRATRDGRPLSMCANNY
ncbi:sodium/potassium-transporting ATPase subunit beta-1-interacting protein isoform X2 [Venturia canescens]|uniref:sodium/potassium-transporting ATPase subunit beta-1-interacting protein isoform X2 n=1 Tax=Venturia canescens TaxID=32260 RepID=UPI001C9CE42A|nr:sodium/potassium-transporting ATPase subunit beta-1-interacting protein isoform X2 [Venturia canescens]